MTALNNQQVAHLFDAAAPLYDRSSNPYAVGRRVEALAALATGDCLEIGGGTGAVSSVLSGKSTVVHSDIAPEMCRVARRKWNLPSVCFDAEAMPFADASFDRVLGAEMIYYLAHPKRCMQEAFRVLRPGGCLVICTTNPLATLWEKGRTVLRRLGFSGMFFDDGAPRFMPLRRLRAMLGTVGFEPVRARHIIPLPLGCCDIINRGLERTPLSRLGLFLVIVAQKPKAPEPGANDRPAGSHLG